MTYKLQIFAGENSLYVKELTADIIFYTTEVENAEVITDQKTKVLSWFDRDAFTCSPFVSDYDEMLDKDEDEDEDEDTRTDQPSATRLGLKQVVFIDL